MKPIDLNVLVSGVAKLFEETANGKGIEIDCTLDPYPFNVQGDSLQIEQALINIIKNSMEAIAQTPGGKIEIITLTSTSKIIIRDNGHGLPNESGPYQFNPFFSTKRDGQGIGLTMTKEILMNHGCEFTLATVKPGQTDFTIGFKKG
jgi:C4-dicarboxylate-specific signal transduction histidine kinase